MYSHVHALFHIARLESMRIPGVFHHLSKVDEQKFRQDLGHICHQWHIDCLQNDESAGFLVEISGGPGTAKGSLSALSVGLGPFMCLL